MPRARIELLIPPLFLLVILCVGFLWSHIEINRQDDIYTLGPVEKPIDNETSDRPGEIDTQARVPLARRIVAVGDLHGDYANALKVLQMSNVVDERGNWSGEVDVLVQTGDIIDGGNDTIKLFMMMEDLRAQALSVGGCVISLLGNHEWMNLLGDWRYVRSNEIKTFGSIHARKNMLQNGSIGRPWQSNYSMATRVPLHPAFGQIGLDYDPAATESNRSFSHTALSFVHGGLSPTYEHLTPYPSKINTLGSRLLQRLVERKFPKLHPPNPFGGLPDDATPEEKSIYGPNGPLWYRGWALKEDKVVCDEVDGVLQQIGVRRLIMGHTPNLHKIVSRCGGKAIIIDTGGFCRTVPPRGANGETGISRTKGGILSALSINYTLVPDKDDGRRWEEREVVTAIYPTSQEVLVTQEREVFEET